MMIRVYVLSHLAWTLVITNINLYVLSLVQKKIDLNFK